MANPSGESDANKPLRRPAEGTPAPLAECLRRPLFSRLLQQANVLAKVNAVFHELLPQPLPEHATITRIAADAWTVQVDSPVWATRLRYSLPRIRPRLGERLATEVPPLRIRIVPAETPEPAPPPRRMTMPGKAAELIEGTARSIADPDLSAALMRLASHARRSA